MVFETLVFDLGEFGTLSHCVEFSGSFWNDLTFRHAFVESSKDNLSGSVRVRLIPR